jgi:hypothetical protein
MAKAKSKKLPWHTMPSEEDMQMFREELALGAKAMSKKELADRLADALTRDKVLTKRIAEQDKVINTVRSENKTLTEKVENQRKELDRLRNGKEKR